MCRDERIKEWISQLYGSRYWGECVQDNVEFIQDYCQHQLSRQILFVRNRFVNSVTQFTAFLIHWLNYSAKFGAKTTFKTKTNFSNRDNENLWKFLSSPFLFAFLIKRPIFTSPSKLISNQIWEENTLVNINQSSVGIIESYSYAKYYIPLMDVNTAYQHYKERIKENKWKPISYVGIKVHRTLKMEVLQD